MKCPCKGCTDRHGGCHATCERYSEFHAFNAERREWLKKDQLVSNYEHDEAQKNLIKTQRKRKNVMGGKNE